MRDVPATPAATLRRARERGLRNGLHFVYTGNVHDRDGASTWCPGCGAMLIERDWYELGAWNVTDDGRCRACDRPLPGRFDGPPGSWGRRRMPVRLAVEAT
jgi:pyruvate formate lyase activating enzyme